MFGGGNEEKGRMNDVYILDFSTMVKCVCVCVSAWACLCVCMYLFVSVSRNGQTNVCSGYRPCMSMSNKLYAQIVFSVSSILRC